MDQGSDSFSGLSLESLPQIPPVQLSAATGSSRRQSIGRGRGRTNSTETQFSASKDAGHHHLLEHNPALAHGELAEHVELGNLLNTFTDFEWT